MADFTWSPDYGGTLSEQPRVRLAQFGDGYSQASADGINANLGRFELKFTARDATERAAILAFLRSKGGVTSFTFIDAEGTTRTVRCGEWTSTPSTFGRFDLTAVFQEVAG